MATIRTPKIKPEIREIRIEYVSGKHSPALEIEVFHTASDVEIQFKDTIRKGKKRFATDGVFAIGADREEAWELFKKLITQRIKNQDPEKIYIL